MAKPKGYMTNINIQNQKVGPDRRQEILDGISDKGTFLPKGVLEEDMDQSFIDYMNDSKGLSISVDGEKLPVIFLTIQRWTEFTKTWKFTDKYKNIEMPFVTVVRNPDIQQGQNQAGLWNIPPDRTYTYMKVPTWDGVRRGVDLYKVPQPTSVDLTYEVRIFTNKMKDLNRFNRKIQRAFQSRQCYINVNGHPMPLHLENIGDESNIEDFENRRFYVQLFEIKLIGYLLDEDDFEVVPTLNRSLVTIEVDEKTYNENITFTPTKNENKVNFDFIWKPNSEFEFSFISQYPVSFTRISEIDNINRIILKINGIVFFDGTILNTPLIFDANDNVSVKIYKNNNLSVGSFKLIGNTI
jgi:hypothetical protein